MTEEAIMQPLIQGSTRLYVIVGDPIAQAKSPLVFNPLLARAGMDAVLLPMHVHAENFEPTMRGVMALGNLAGVIITVPFKTRSLGLVDTVLPMARTAGAVNAIRRDPDGRWSGDIFDGRGLVRGLRQHDVALPGRRVMLLGAGGAGSAVAVALAEAGVSLITINDLDHRKAIDLAERVTTHFPRCRVVASTVDIAGHDLLVNATPSGMHPSSDLPTPLEGLNSNVTVVDIVMKPEVTPLLAEARARGCLTYGGRLMIEGQATELLEFFGVRLDQQPDGRKR